MIQEVSGKVRRVYPTRFLEKTPDGHHWYYFTGEWQDVVRRCKKCKRYQFNFYCWSRDQWADKIITNSSVNDVKLKQMFGDTIYKIYHEFLLPLEKLNSKCRKNCADPKFLAAIK